MGLAVRSWFQLHHFCMEVLLACIYVLQFSAFVVIHHLLRAYLRIIHLEIPFVYGFWFKLVDSPLKVFVVLFEWVQAFVRYALSFFTIIVSFNILIGLVMKSVCLFFKNFTSSDGVCTMHVSSWDHIVRLFTTIYVLSRNVFRKSFLWYWMIYAWNILWLVLFW